MDFIFLDQYLDDKNKEYENYINDNSENRKNENGINNIRPIADIKNDKTEELKKFNQESENGKRPNEIIKVFDNQKNDNCEINEGKK